MQDGDYGICPCEGAYQARTVEVRMNVNGSTVVLHSVPQGTCPACGSRVYKGEVLAVLEALMKRSASATDEGKRLQ